MKLVVDMNLSPQWVPLLVNAGHEAIHWSSVGNPKARDEEIMAWARLNACVVFTNDLDFGTILAQTNASGPSVIQMRTQDVSPASSSSVLLAALKQTGGQLERGALVVIDNLNMRVRILPLD